MVHKILTGTVGAALAASMLAIGTSTVVRADSVSADVPLRPYISAMGHEAFSDVSRHTQNRHSKNGYGGYLGLGWAVNRWIGLEVGGDYTTYAANRPPAGFATVGSWYQYTGEGQMLIFGSRNPWFSPYVLFGAGIAKNVSRSTHESDTSLLLDAGVGAISYFNVGGFPLGVRVDARYRFVNINDMNVPKFDALAGAEDGDPHFGLNRIAEPVISLGLVLPLGHGPTPAPTPLPAAPAAPPPPPPPICHAPAGFKVDANCKIIPQKVVLRSINFQFDSAILTDPAKASLDKLSTALKGQPKLNIQIDGYTDNRGARSYNHRLSQRRADAVLAYLVHDGVAAARLTAVGHGPSDPVSSNDTAAGRALNRRVVFTVTNTVEHVQTDLVAPTRASVQAAKTGEPSCAKDGRDGCVGVHWKRN